MPHTAGRQAHDMKYGIMLTSLYGGDGGNRIAYYVTGDGSRRLYCDAMLSAEASSKYILANHHQPRHQRGGRRQPARQVERERPHGYDHRGGQALRHELR